MHNEVDANNGLILLTNNSGENYEAILDGLFSIMDDKSYDLPKIKIENLMVKKMYEEDVSSGLKTYSTFKLDTLNYSTSEKGLNTLGYKLLAANKNDEALAVFKLNMEEYPNSANMHDSYGDVLLITGDSINALKKFKQCFEMDSSLIFSRNKAVKLEAMLDLK